MDGGRRREEETSTEGREKERGKGVECDDEDIDKMEKEL